MRKLAVLLAFAPLLVSATASSEPKPQPPPRAATLRVLEGAPGEARVVLDRLQVTRRVRWESEADRALYAGVTESLVEATLHADARASDALLDGVSRATEVDPQLGRPPRVALMVGARAYEGVLDDASTRCDDARCEATITLREARQAEARRTEDPTRWPGF